MQFDQLKRREFIRLFGGAAAWPLAARAQQPAMPVVGLLRSTTAAPFTRLVAELRRGLGEEGFTEGRNIAIEQRWADNQPDRLPDLAADLVRRKVAVIVRNCPAVVARAAGPIVPGRAAIRRRPGAQGPAPANRRSGGAPRSTNDLRIA